MIRQLLKTTYESVYSLLPQKGKVAASQVVFRLTKRPNVYYGPKVHPVSCLQRGAVAFSIDFELAWAWQYAKNKRESCISIGLREREQVPLILGKFDEYGIPATWATVGHLFLRSCERGRDGLAHPEMPRLPHLENEYWRFNTGDWFQHDPCTDFQKDPAWYAPDLIEKILASHGEHEIACHGFSHAGFGAYCPPEVAEAEIDASISAMKTFGVRPSTWVFPGNDEGHFGLLAAKGFRIVRAFPKSWAEISLPIKGTDGIWRVHDSTAVDLEGQGWNFEERLQRLKKYVDKAAETRLSAHIWFHPSLPADQMNSLLFPLLRYCADLREKGLIDIFTMEQLVKATEKRLNP